MKLENNISLTQEANGKMNGGHPNEDRSSDTGQKLCWRCRMTLEESGEEIRASSRNENQSHVTEYTSQRDKPMIHPCVDPPVCEDCQKQEFSFFDPACPGCYKILENPNTTVAEIYAILRQWTPQTQQNLELLVNEVLRRGAHINDKDGLTDMTLLHYASKSGAAGIGDAELASNIVSMLLEKGADPHSRCRWTKMTALHYAAYFDVVPVIKILLKATKAIDIDSRCSEFDNGTALHIAVSNLAHEAVKVLLQNGANPILKDDNGRSPIDCIPDPSDLDSDPDMPLTVIKLKKTLQEASVHIEKKPPPNYDLVQSKVTLQSLGINLGDKCMVGGVKMGTLRYCGPTEFSGGIWAGIELDETAGKNDGSIGGISYFNCPPNHGIFAPVSKIAKPGSAPAKTSTTPSPAKVPLGRLSVDVSNIRSRIDTGVHEKPRHVGKGANPGTPDKLLNSPLNKGDESCNRKTPSAYVDRHDLRQSKSSASPQKTKHNHINHTTPSRTVGSPPSSMIQTDRRSNTTIEHGKRSKTPTRSNNLKSSVTPNKQNIVSTLTKPSRLHSNSPSRPNHRHSSPLERTKSHSPSPASKPNRSTVHGHVRYERPLTPKGMDRSSARIITRTNSTGLNKSRENSIASLAEIEVGDRVIVAGQRKGTVRFVGETKFAPGIWFGIELDRPAGKNDGSVSGVKYFSCQMKHGVFAPLSRIQKITPEMEEWPDQLFICGDSIKKDILFHKLGDKRFSSNESLETISWGAVSERIEKRSSSAGIMLRDGRPRTPIKRPKSGIGDSILRTPGSGGNYKLEVGMSVFCSNELGILRYIGPTDFGEGVWVGVELRTPKGKNDGSVQGHRYFTCKPDHGLLVKPNKITVRGINGAKLIGDNVTLNDSHTNGDVKENGK